MGVAQMPLFEEWSADPEIRRQQIEAVLGRRKPLKKRAQKKRSKPKLPGERAPVQRFWYEPEREKFLATLPPYIDCAGDDLRTRGTYRRHRDLAINFPLIQFNSPYRRRWLPFDLDRSNAATAFDDAAVAMPNVIMINPANGHAHAAYELAAPVTYYAKSRQTSIRYLADIQHGMTRRLDADAAYSGHLTKNPFHENWITIAPRVKPYTLGELASYLDKEDMRAPKTRGLREIEMCGLSRNCSLFGWVRTEIAYKQVLCLKREGAPFRDFLNLIFNAALDKNREAFRYPLNVGEVAGIARSVAQWTWREFNQERFSKRQSRRGKRGMAKRWADHMTAAERAAAAGVSRATLYRRQKANGQAQGETITISG
jgi:hypothetical protein